MWVSEKLRRGTEVETAADLGVTTVAGGPAGVTTRGELRQLPVFGPGGVSWKPDSGDTVLVIQGGTGGQEVCVAGAEDKNAPADLEPGELCLHTAGGAEIRLRRDGGIEIWGALTINGVPYGE